jgi:ABC-2 type transport system permease protein
MRKVLVILRKEVREIVQQRVLLFSILLPPLLFAVLPLILLQRVGAGSNASTLHIPSLEGLTLHEYTQGVIGTTFSNFYILLPMIVPSIIAAYSIIGEKNNHTLEPVLATPVRRWQLLTGKMLSAVIVTWISGAVAAFSSRNWRSSRMPMSSPMW